MLIVEPLLLKEMTDMKVHQIKIDFNVTESIKRYVYVYILEGKNLYLIDSGVAGSQTQIIEYIKKIGRDETEIKSIFLTHAHPDHIGSAAWFKENVGCTIYAGEKECDWIENIDLQYKKRPIPNFYRLAGESVTVDYRLKDKDKIILEDDCILHVIETSGHSLGELSYLLEDALFVGDSIPVKGDIPIYEDKDKLLESLDKIKSMKDNGIEYFYPAWDNTYSAESIEKVIEDAKEIVKEIENATRIALQENGEVETTIKKVCQILNKPMLEKHPLFTKTVYAHILSENLKNLR